MQVRHFSTDGARLLSGRVRAYATAIIFESTVSISLDFLFVQRRCRCPGAPIDAGVINTRRVVGGKQGENTPAKYFAAAQRVGKGAIFGRRFHVGRRLLRARTVVLQLRQVVPGPVRACAPGEILVHRERRRTTNRLCVQVSVDRRFRSAPLASGRRAVCSEIGRAAAPRVDYYSIILPSPAQSFFLRLDVSHTILLIYYRTVFVFPTRLAEKYVCRPKEMGKSKTRGMHYRF